MSAGLRVRPAAVAGRFYPDDATTLAMTIDDALANAAPWTGPPPKALVVPHAAYVYSGPVAASGYCTLAAARDTIRRVVLIGPAHFVRLNGLALSSADAFVTPLGPVPVDTEARASLLDIPGVVVDDAAHAPEHSLEVQLPFLQRTLADFSIVPIVVGAAAMSAVAAVLDAAWGGPETLIVLSSDLSHYLDHDTATRHDRATAATIVAGEPDRLSAADACGATPLRGLLQAAHDHGVHADLLDLRTSADTAGDPDRVVGYGAFVFGCAATP